MDPVENRPYSEPSFRELLQANLYMIDFKDLRVIEEPDGTITFQGMGKRK